jgi:hypothetical protein
MKFAEFASKYGLLCEVFEYHYNPWNVVSTGAELSSPSFDGALHLKAILSNSSTVSTVDVFMTMESTPGIEQVLSILQQELLVAESLNPDELTNRTIYSPRNVAAYHYLQRIRAKNRMISLVGKQGYDEFLSCTVDDLV